MLAERILKGDVRSASRLMRWIDDRDPGAIPELQALFSRTGRARIVGITGSPGTGKSTLTDTLIGAYRRQGKTVGVVAVDPTSPFTGGALLGDRIRMQDHATDPGVFIRSLATRGALGGLSRASSDVVRVLDAMGKDVILVETVGVGQDEVEIVATADVSVVVLVPGLGDEVQAQKAGIMEIADVFVVNKADREGAERVVAEIQSMLSMAAHDARRPEIVQTVAVRDEGIDALLLAIEAFRGRAEDAGLLQQRRRAQAQQLFLDTLQERLMQAVRARVLTPAESERTIARLAARELDPLGAAEDVVRRLLH